jgi:hypothetical protein
MADATDAVRTRLTAHAGASALISTRAWFGYLPQNPTLPASVVQQITGTRESAMGADVGKFAALIQVKAHATTRAGAKALAEQQRAALQRYSGTSAGTVVLDSFLVNEDDEMEPEEGIWSVRQDFRVWVTE